MPANIRIDITHGARFVSDADRSRALAAALDALGAADPVSASAEFRRQVDASMGDTSTLSGLAMVWDRVQSAADRALTEGWHDTEGAYCEVVVL